jgi:hypothetical protein
MDSMTEIVLLKDAYKLKKENKRPMGHISHLSHLGQYRKKFSLFSFVAITNNFM